MTYLADFLQKLAEQKAAQPAVRIDCEISPYIIELAERLVAWHEKTRIPDRWYPLQLGRTAAQFNTSRESMAAALRYAGFQETKTSTVSLWTRANFNKE